MLALNCGVKGVRSVCSAADQSSYQVGAAVRCLVKKGIHVVLQPLVSYEFESFVAIDRAVRCVLLVAAGRAAHVLVFHGNQRADKDSERVALNNKRFRAVMMEAAVAAAGQLVIIVGDTYVEPSGFPCWVRGIADGFWIDLTLAYAAGLAVGPASTCRLGRDTGYGAKLVFCLVDSTALAAPVALCFTLFSPHLAVGSWLGGGRLM